MGCLGELLLFLCLFHAIRWLWRTLVAPLLGVETASTSSHARRTKASHAYIALLMPLLAKIAKSDGRVSEAEISGVERIFVRLKLTADERRFAQEAFLAAKDSTTTFDAYAVAFAQRFHDFEVRLITLQFMIQVANADATVTAAERDLLLRAAQLFNIPPFLIAQLFAGIGGGAGYGYSSSSSGRERYRASTRPTTSRSDDLQLLGLNAGATDDEIKRAYRQKVKELHPDRLHAQGLPESMIQQATERMAAINAAYERLKKR